MGKLSEILEKIKNGQLNRLLPPLVQELSNNGRQQVARHCSHYVHSNPNLEEAAFTSIVDTVVQCLNLQQEDGSEGDPEHLFKSMYFIIVTAVKRKDLHHYLVKLLSVVEPVVKHCVNPTGDIRSYAKSLYQNLWNASFTETDPIMALTLRQFSLQYQFASGAPMSVVCSQAYKIQISSQESAKSVEHIDRIFRIHLSILDNIIHVAQKETALSDEVVLHIHRLAMEFAKMLLRLNECASYCKISKDVVTLCENRTDEQTLQTLKIGLKLAECGMALKVGWCERDKMKKMVSTSSSVFRTMTKGLTPKVLTLNTIAVRSLLTILAMFTVQQEEEVEYSLEGAMLTFLLETLLSWCNASLSEEDARKVATILYEHVGSFMKMFETAKKQEKTKEEQNSVLKEALLWGTRTKEFYKSHVRHKEDWQGHYYNLGVYSGNVGILAFGAGKNEIPNKLLELSVEMMVQYHSIVSQQQQLGNVMAVLTKCVKTWSDALRYSGQFMEAGVAAALAVLWGFSSPCELLSIWVKCKRDARKVNIDAIQGMTVCEIVSEAQRRWPEVSHIPFNSMWALKEEIKCYRSQCWNTSGDALACGERLLEKSESVKDRAEGLLTVTVALLESNKSADTALRATSNARKAIELLNIAKSERELLAQAHFWLYLCQLQYAEMTAPEVELEDLQKPQASLSTQAADLGDEVQVDDQCDVRPSAFTFTLATQSTSLAPLHTALDIWCEMATQGMTLEDGDRTCSLVASAAYVYQLSCLVTPTVSCWYTLLTFARSHNLHGLLVKGVTELVLVVGELVPESLVMEAEAVGESLHHKPAAQDFSPSYLITSLHAAIALYCLKLGEYQKGARYLTKALQSDVFGKSTMGATEVQVVVNLVASYYALLPHHLFNGSLPAAKPANVHAFLACRQGIALIRSATSAIQDGLVCYHHRVAWLHLTTTVWLGKLCLASAQPRVARAYLGASLRIAHQFTLPLWVAELLELLARVDLMCDQFEDCLVKVEKLRSILTVHSTASSVPSTSVSSSATITAPSKYLAPIPCSLEADKRTKKHYVQVSEVSPEWEEEEQWMRDKSRTIPDYNVKSVTFNPSLVVIGNEKRLPVLTNPQLTSSPSTEFREDVSVMQVVQCPEGLVECVLCSSPLLHHLFISTTNLLAMVHAYAGRHRPATTCLSVASRMYSLVTDKASDICSRLRALMGGKLTDSQSMFVHFHLNEVRIRTEYGRAEILALEGKLEEALSISQKALTMISTLPLQLLYQDAHTILVTQLQAVKLEQMVVKQQAHTSQQIAEISPESLCAEDNKYPGDFSTPVCTRKPPTHLSAVKTVRPTRKSSRPILKTKCPTTPHSLQKSSQRLNYRTLHATQRADAGAFSIFSDENEGSMRVSRSATPAKMYKGSSSKTNRKDMTAGSSVSSTSVAKPKASRSLAKKMSEEENVCDTLSKTVSPKDIVLEVARSSKKKICKNTGISKQKESEDTVEKVNIKESRKSKKNENLDDTYDPSNITDSPNNVIFVPMSSQIKIHKNSPRQKGCDDAEKVLASTTTKPRKGTRQNVDCRAETESSTNPDGSLLTLAQMKETRRRGRSSKSVRIIDAESNRTSSKISRVKPPSVENESEKTPSDRSRGRPSRSTRTLR